jgi:photosystem II stability/assembly factor-like uncharacterized protein
MQPDGKFGMVVGQMSTILLTRDGGIHWSQVRNQQRPAPWFIALCGVLALILILIYKRARRG